MLLLSLCWHKVNGLSFFTTCQKQFDCLSPSPYQTNMLRTPSSLFLQSDDSEDDDFDDDDDEEPPAVDVSNFQPPSMGMGVSLGRGRTSPSIRKALGNNNKSVTKVHVCTNCGAEFVKWMGRCSNCREWNTIQEMAVNRSPISSFCGGGLGSNRPKPIFGGTGGVAVSGSGGGWVGSGGLSGNNYDPSMFVTPQRITQVIEESNNNNLQAASSFSRRLVVPDDDELNQVLGGGILPGSLLLIGGDPGVGKSTLMLQAAGSLASLATPQVGIGMGPGPKSATSNSTAKMGPVWYVSGEETVEQIAARAQRLGISSSELFLLTETHVDTLAEQVVQLAEQAMLYQQAGNEDAYSPNSMPPMIPPSLIVMDSIQTMVCDAAGASAAGGVSQVRECMALLLRLAKSTKIPIIVVGHVTKSGDVAGPRTVEHMVDAVLYLEGNAADGGINSLRLLRATKNRFGSTLEVGMYSMSSNSGRLKPIRDPSALLLQHRLDTQDVEGSSIALCWEGVRAMTVEVQALATFSSGDGAARRNVNGLPYARLLLLLGVLQKYVKVYLGKYDVYVNVVGTQLSAKGDEGSSHASDLAVVVALVSSWASIPVRADTAFCGQVGLLGELRQVAALDQRLLEASRMGFSRVVTARQGGGRSFSKKSGRGNAKVSKIHGMEWIQCDTVKDAINAGLVSPLPRRTKSAPNKKGRAGKPAPGSMEDLQLNDIILDDEEDDDMEAFG